MKKKKTIKIRLKSTESGFFYVTNKNARNMPEKMTKNKYDPTLRRHVLFKEEEIK